MTVSSASVVFSATKGYIIKLNNTQLWSPALPSRYICGNSDRYIFTASPDYQTAVANDPLGTFIVFAIGIIITAIVVAIVPLLVALSKQMFGIDSNVINYIKNNAIDKSTDRGGIGIVDVDDSDGGPGGGSPKHGLSIFTIAWICVAAIIILFVGVLVSQLLCYNMRWRNIYRNKIVNECYELDIDDKKNILDDSDDSFMSNNVDLVYNKNGDTAVFTLKAQQGTYYSDNGSIKYEFNPASSKFTCKDVPVVRIGDVYVGNKRTKKSCSKNELLSYAQYCKGSFFEEEDYSWENVKSDERAVSGNTVTITAYDSKYHDRYKKIYDDYSASSTGSTSDFQQSFMKSPGSSFGAGGAWCAANGCTRSKARVTYHVNYWSLCSAAGGGASAVATRTKNGASGKLDTNGFSRLIGSDYPHGYYDLSVAGAGIEASGDISNRVKRDSNSEIDYVYGYYVFNDGEVNENRIVSHVLANNIEYKYGMLRVRAADSDYGISGKSFDTSRGNTITYTLTGASRYDDFKHPCVRVSAYDAVVDGINHVYVQSADTEVCYLTLGWPYGGTQLVILSPGSVQDITGAVTWSCETSEDYSAVGVYCSQTKLNNFTTPQHNKTKTILPVVYSGCGFAVTAQSNEDSGIINGNITVKKIIAYVAVIACSLLVIFGVVMVIIKIVKNKREKRVE